ncbi:rRNA maturation RNase YbeY [Patescibacteria group bacterium]|nr:rRNA maturation RNase YbeY [Patescibacteria group bacterium]
MLEVSNLTKKKICRRSLKRIAEAFLEKYKTTEAEISLVLIGDQRSRTLNKKYRQKDYATDVLSFSNPDFKTGKDNFLGEIFINLNEVSRLKKYREMFLELEGIRKDKKFEEQKLAKRIREFSSLKLSKTARLAQEKYLLHFIFIHGLLHLIGLDDKREAERLEMLKLGFNFLANLEK